MNRTFYIRHPDKGIFFADDQARYSSHCLMSEELATAMVKELQAYPETRGAVVREFDEERIQLAGYKPFVLG